jgi:hypothetical protein
LLESGVMKRISHDTLGGAPIGSKFVYDVKIRSPTCEVVGPCYKTLADGRKVRYKARLVVKGFQQKEGIHYDPDETYAPTPQIASIRLLSALAFSKGWTTRGADVKQAFVQAELPAGQQVPIKLPKAAGLSADYLYLLLRSRMDLSRRRTCGTATSKASCLSTDSSASTVIWAYMLVTAQKMSCCVCWPCTSTTATLRPPTSWSRA